MTADALQQQLRRLQTQVAVLAADNVILAARVRELEIIVLEPADDSPVSAQLREE